MVLLSHAAALVVSGLALIQGTLAQSIPGFNDTEVSEPRRNNETLFDSIFPGINPKEETPGPPAQPGQNSTNSNSTVTGSIFPGVKPNGDPPEDPPGQNITNGTMTDSIFPSLKNVTRSPPPKTFTGLFRPSKDSWYRPQPGFLVSPPGDLLKIRPAPGILPSMLKNLKSADQILYRTSDTYLNPSWGLTTFLVPKEWDRTKALVVSWQLPYESANFDSSPSYLLSTGSPEIRYDILDHMLAKGWHVSIPDYQGPKAAFGAGKMGGYSVLDSMRAIRTIGYGRYGLDPWKIRYLAWGYSGGALATAWAFLEKKEYCGAGHQKLVDNLHNKLHSFAIGGLPVKLLHTLDAVSNQVPAGFAINAISGMMQEFPRVRKTVEQYGKTRGAHNISVFERVRSMSLRESMEEYTYANISDYFNGGLAKVIARLRKKNFHEFIKVSDPAPKHTEHGLDNLLVYHGVNDRMIPIAHVDKLLHRHWCNFRVQIEFLRNHEGGHEEASGNSNDVVLEWIARRFNIELEFDGQAWTPRERWPMGNHLNEGCLVHEGAYKAPLWDFDTYMKGLNPVGESDQELK